ncbi:MAG TPA: T9SS type A sorting domain-containing protein [Flavobacteriales bacterium]|nr:T9SS type A sorting domain-containing protein [Flavobacteriales bacterium]
MRAAILFASCVVATIGQAQDWALINPEYKYNYSNDGTDTIRHQVKVINSETLGAEISVFQLNRTAEYCLWCGEGCDLRQGITQFMQGSCTATGTNWQFNSPSALEIKATAALGEQWTFDQQNATVATVTSIVEGTMFGITDSIRTMVSELADTIVWSKNYGVLVWHMHEDTRYQLIGIQGPDVGIIVPSISEFIPFQAGDIVEMRISRGFSNSSATQRVLYRRFQIEERLDSLDHIRYIGYAWEITESVLHPPVAPHDGPFVWELEFGNDSILMPIYSAPGELVELGHPLPSEPNSPRRQMVAKHYLDQEGHYVIAAEPGASPGYGIFTSDDVSMVGCVSLETGPMYSSFRLDTELGIRGIGLNHGPYYNHFTTIGAVISGDTIGTIHSDSFMQIPEPVVPRGLYPNPTNEAFSLQDTISDASIEILGIDQRLIRSTKPQGASSSVPVGDLPPGNYVVIVNGLPPQRLVIAR